MNPQDTKVTDIVDQNYKDIESERTLLAYCLTKQPTTVITPQLFTIVPHKLISRIITKYRITITPKMLFNGLAKSVKKEKLEAYKIASDKIYNTDIKGVDDKNIALIIDTLKELYVKRERLIKADSYIKAVVSDNQESIDSIAREIVQIGVEEDTINSGEIVADYKSRRKIVLDRKNNEVVGIPTGIKKLDAITGGLMTSEIATIIGESSVGKSMILQSVGISAYTHEQRYNVFHLSLEMSKEDVGFRADANLARVALSNFRTGEMSQQDLSKWQHRMTELEVNHQNYYHVEYCPRSCTVEELEQLIYKAQDKYRAEVDLVVVDYLNLLRSEEARKGQRDWSVQADIAWSLKALASNLNSRKGCSLLTANQIRDEFYGKKSLSLTSLKYGRAISEVFAVVLGIVKDSADEIMQQMRIEILKHRNVKKCKPIVIQPRFDMAYINSDNIHKKSLDDFE